MMVQTSRFGEVEVADEQRISLPEGLLGFEHVLEYCLIPHSEESPFLWMQAVTDESLAFVVINPFDFFTDYDFDISDADVEKLGLSDVNDVVVMSVVTFGEDEVTSNLVGPIVVNRRSRAGKQIVLSDPRYKTRHTLMKQPTAA